VRELRRAVADQTDGEPHTKILIPMDAPEGTCLADASRLGDALESDEVILIARNFPSEPVPLEDDDALRKEFDEVVQQMMLRVTPDKQIHASLQACLHQLRTLMEQYDFTALPATETTRRALGDYLIGRVASGFHYKLAEQRRIPGVID